MIFTTFYFSGTGNTKWAVNQLHKIVLAKEHQSAVYSIEENLQNIGELIRKSDIIGFAFPIYAMNIPPIMKQFLQKVSQSISGDSKKPVFVITTIGYADGCGPTEVIKQLKLKNFMLKGYISLKIANNISTPMIKSKPISPDKMKKRLEDAKAKITGMVEILGSGKKKIDFLAYPMVVFRKKMSKMVTNAYKQLTIDNTTCIKCMHCSNQCPSKSIVLNNDQLIILPSCTACMRCFNICPTYSIWHGGRYADPKEFIRYKNPMEALSEFEKNDFH